MSAAVETLLSQLAEHIERAGWQQRTPHPVHPGWCYERGRLLRLSLYYRATDQRWTARHSVGGTQIVSSTHADPMVALAFAHDSAERILRETTALLHELIT